MEVSKENKKLYSKKSSKKNVIKVEINVPDQVLLGLILGIIEGPLNNLPKKNANVSLVNERKIIKKNKNLSLSKIL